MTEVNDIKKTDMDQIPNESYLEPFYTDILSKQFSSSAESIDYCRKLCAQFGFTIKQEASTYRNIYVYCSREGFPDSLRNPKSNPKRRRPSKRCDCRWRIVLNENEGKWAFRKSLNPEASKHNHELMKPEEIETSWPKEMLDLICKLARERLPTPDIRTRVQLLYPHISWNERRFYNRLSEERQKIRIRDAQQRVKHLNHTWSNLCTASAGSQELVDIVSSEMNALLDKVCKMTQTDPSTLLPPTFLDDNNDNHHPPPSMDDHHSNDDLNDHGDSSSQDEPTTKSSPKNQNSNKSSNSDTPKGFTKITLPEQNYYIKLHPHRILQDVQQLYRRRSRSLAFSDDCSSEFGQYPDEMTLKKHKSIEAEYNDLSNFSNRPMDHHQQQQQSSSIMSTSTTTTMTPQGHFMYPPQNCKDQQQYYASNIYPSFHPPPPSSTNLSPRYMNHPLQHSSINNNSNNNNNSMNTNNTNNNTNSNNHPDQSMDLYSRQQLHHIPTRTSPPLEQQQQHSTTDLTTQTMTPVSISNHPPNSPMTPAPTNLSTQPPPIPNNLTLMSTVQTPPPPQAYMMDQQRPPPPPPLHHPHHPHHPHHHHHQQQQQQPIYYTHLSHDNNNNNNSNNNNNNPNDQTTYYMNPRMHTH